MEDERKGITLFEKATVAFENGQYAEVI